MASILILGELPTALPLASGPGWEVLEPMSMEVEMDMEMEMEVKMEMEIGLTNVEHHSLMTQGSLQLHIVCCLRTKLLQSK